jgi:ABC-type sugar transport system permease subunit
MGYASAMGWIVGLIVMVFVAIYFYVNNRKEKN